MRFGVACCLLAFVAASVRAQEIPLSKPVRVSGAEKYVYRSVDTGAVGYPTGIVWCARKPENLFIRADAGGIWKLDRTTGRRWICLTDTIPFRWRDMVAVDSLAVHPDNPSIIYIAGGTRLGAQHDVLKTEDGGKTWSRLNVRNAAGRPVSNDAGGESRQAGERLAIDLNSPEILFFATRNDGLLTSKDGGKSWKTVESFPEKGKAWAGLTFAVGDYASDKAGQPTQRWYVGVHPDRNKSFHGGLYVTEDAGETWRRIDSGPGLFPKYSIPMRLRIAQDGAVYLSTIGHGLWRYRNGEWLDVTPTDARNRPLCGINIHPQDSRQLLVAQTLGQAESAFYYSKDGGENWQRYAYIHARPQENNVILGDFPAWVKAQANPSWGANASDIAFDPAAPGVIWHTSLAGACRIDGVGANQVTASLIYEGCEQGTGAEAISSTNGAPLISGVHDVGGFRHAKLDEAPASRLQRMEPDGTTSQEDMRRFYQDVFDMDVQPGKPGRVVLCGGWQWNQTGEAAYSLDNGRTFRPFPAQPFDRAKFGRIAIGVDPANVLWAPLGNASTGVFFTRDNGRNWVPSDSAPLGMMGTDDAWSFFRCLAADRVAAGVFYIYDRRDGRFYRSEDGGERFKIMARLPAQRGVQSDWHRLEATPWREGDVWLSLREQGLLHSTDGGKNWVRLNGVQWSENIAFGLPRKQGDYPAIYLLGHIGDEKPAADATDSRVYRSDDGGASWTDISDELNGFATASSGFAGDMQSFGRVYIGTRARGIFVGEPTPQTP